MLLYPKEIEQRLEVDAIREAISKFCSTEHAAQRIRQLQPLDNYDQLSKYLVQTREMIRVISSDDKPAVNTLHDLSSFNKKVRTKGAFLGPEDLSLLKSGLVVLYEWSQFLKKRAKEYPQLSRLALGFVADKELVEEIDSKIDEKGEVRDNATPELSAVRKKLFAAERQVRKVMQSVLDRSKKDEFTEEDGAVTIRGGRLVIPVKAEFKRKLPGFVHDESSTGQTVFMEPTEVLDLNNQVREFQYEERREIIRILTVIADRIRERLDDLVKGNEFLLRLDVVLAKALYAKAYEAVVPQLTKKPQMNIVAGRHPILWRKNTDQGKSVVPLDITLGSDQRILVISGPNAGGKSVALKTVGILQYALQCGFPIPVDEASEFGIFRNLFVDIGDSQSLENDLSTYSSHLKAMKYFSEFADKWSLVLIDEFGTGTEPQFGGSIAQAILGRLNHSKCKGVVTTHYSNLKEFAEKADGLTNAAMRYDVERLEPLFQLEIGKPGSSFAMEIAEKIGLAKSVLKEAKSLVGYDQVNYNKLLGRLDAERNKLDKNNRQVVSERQELAGLRADYESLRKMVEAEKKKILKEAKQEALGIIEGANKQVERTIREIKEKSARKEETRKARQNLADSGRALEKDLKSLKKPVSKQDVSEMDNSKIKVGDKVRLDQEGAIGEVLAVKGRQAEVLFGALKSWVKLDRLVPVSNRQARKEVRSAVKGLDLNERRTGFSHELDVRGKRGEEVLPLLEKMLDDALILGTSELRILHGKGHGILKELIRNHLKDDPNVLSLQDEHADRGGSGITIVNLK